MRRILNLDIHSLTLFIGITEEIRRASFGLIIVGAGGAGLDDAFGLRVEPVEGGDAAAAAGFPALGAWRERVCV